MSKGDFRSKLPLLLLLLITGGVIAFWYGSILIHPNDHLFHKYGDGLKNYYAPWYHVKHDSSFSHFGGMNYPYGEQLSFADGQPLISNSLQFISQHIVDVSDSTIGILNLLMLLNPLLTAIFLFLIFRRLGVNAWYAAFAGAAIALMSPQLLRTSAHYALAYSFWIPLFWYLAIRSWEKDKVKWSLLLAGALFLSAWIHPYYLMIGAVFLTFAWFFRWILFSPRNKKLTHILLWGLQTIVPLILFKLILSWGSTVADRPSDPYGFEEFYATWRTLFLPYPLPGMQWFDRFRTALEISWEGTAYVGLLGSLTIVAFLAGVGKRFFSNKGTDNRFIKRLKRALSPSRNQMLVISVLAGIAIAIFACGFPFAIKPDRLTEFFPPIKQFRSLGRFAWAFYYAWSVFGFYLIYIFWRKFRMQKRLVLSWLVLLPGMLFMVEAFAYQLPVSRKILNETTPEMVMDAKTNPIIRLLNHINPKEYDALLVLPYVHIGSENLFAYDSLAVQAMFPAAMHTGLPLMNVMMSRTSLDQAWKQMQWLGRPLGQSSMLDELPAGSRILILHTGGKSPFDGSELVHHNTPLAQEGKMKLFSLKPSDYAIPLTYHCHSIADTAGWISLPEDSHIFLSKMDPDFYHDRMDDGDAQFGFRNGGKQFNRWENNFVFERQMNGAAGDTLVISYWAKIRQDQLPLTYLGVEEKSPSGEQIVWDYSSFTDDIVALGAEWAFCERKIVIHAPGNTLKLNFTRWKRKPPTVMIDELMVRNVKTEVMDYSGGVVWMNNFPL